MRHLNLSHCEPYVARPPAGRSCSPEERPNACLPQAWLARPPEDKPQAGRPSREARDRRCPDGRSGPNPAAFHQGKPMIAYPIRNRLSHVRRCWVQNPYAVLIPAQLRLRRTKHGLYPKRRESSTGPRRPVFDDEINEAPANGRRRYW